MAARWSPPSRTAPIACFAPTGAAAPRQAPARPAAHGYDPDRIHGGGRPETPEKNDVPGLLAAWGEYKASRYREPPGVEANAVLKPGSDEPRCWWAPFDDVAESDYNLAASRYKPHVAEKAPDEDPADPIRDVLAIERGITEGLEKLLGEVER